MPPPLIVISCLVVTDVLDASVWAGRRFASVTSTAWARRPLTSSHRDVNLARRIEREGPEMTFKGTTDGENDSPNRCNRCFMLVAGKVIVFNACSDKTEVDH
jgi:hypothetical protein